jgi:sigma-B regulation protein RsbQ
MSKDVIRRNNVQVSGRGTQAMVFAHGFGCDQNMWRFVAPAFEDRYRVVLFDYVGSGKSDLKAYDPKRYGTLDGYASDVLDILHELKLEKVVFVGHSVSGMIGAIAARREPTLFANLIMLGPSPRYINDGDYVGGFEAADIDGLLDTMDKNYIGWANFLAPVIMKNPERPELSRELEQSFCSTDPVIARKFAEVTFTSDNRADLPGVATPTLLFQCADDVIAPTSVGEYMRRQMPQATLKVVDVTGHCPHMSHPRETIATMNEYLGSFASAA